MNKEQNCNDLQEIITQALEQIKAEQGASFDIEKVNLAEMERITGISRARLRRLKDNGFVVKPRHPFTKGKVERLVRYVKDNFLAGRVFTTITDLNIEAIRWCNTQNTRYHRSLDCVPDDKHADSCMQVATELRKTLAVTFYLICQITGGGTEPLVCTAWLPPPFRPLHPSIVQNDG